MEIFLPLPSVPVCVLSVIDVWMIDLRRLMIDMITMLRSHNCHIRDFGAPKYKHFILAQKCSTNNLIYSARIKQNHDDYKS